LRTLTPSGAKGVATGPKVELEDLSPQWTKGVATNPQAELEDP